MVCAGWRKHVEGILSKREGDSKVTVDLKKAEAVIETSEHVHIEEFQEALKEDGGTYSIHNIDDLPTAEEETKKKEIKKEKGNGTFYCPMHCEGEKTYDKAGDCPVCGMDLVEEQKSGASNAEQWTCPMHPEIIRDEPGACPIC